MCIMFRRIVSAEGIINTFHLIYEAADDLADYDFKNMLKENLVRKYPFDVLSITHNVRGPSYLA